MRTLILPTLLLTVLCTDTAQAHPKAHQTRAVHQRTVQQNRQAHHAHTAHQPVELCRGQLMMVHTEVSAIQEELLLIQSLAEESYPNRRRILRKLNRLRKQVHRFQREIELARGALAAAPLVGPPAVFEEPEPQGPPPIEAPEVYKLKKQMANQSFAKDKLKVLRQVAPYYLFTSQQVVELIGVFSFAQGKLKALKILAPRLSDPQHAYIIYDAFQFSSDQKKAEKILTHQVTAP